MLDRMTRITEAFFTDVEAIGLVQPQREALIDLLIWTSYVDNTIKAEETEHLNQLIGSLRWESPLQVRQYLGMAYSRVRRGVDDADEGDRVLASITQRLEGAEVRKKALAFAQELAEIDGDLDEREKRFLTLVQEAFSVT